MSLSPISFSSPKVYFRGEGVDINAPGKFSAAPEEGDKVDISKEQADNEAAVSGESKKSNIGKTIGKAAGAVVALLAASYGMFKWKGDKWLLPEAKGFLAWCKKTVVKPGQFIDDKIISKIGSKASKKAAKPAQEAAEAAGDAATQAAGAAEQAATQAAEGAAETVAK